MASYLTVIACFTTLLTWDIAENTNNVVLVAFFQGGCSKDSVCQHVCVDIDNGYICRCHPGYSINKDGISCSGSPLENTVDTANNQLSSKDGDNKTLGSIRDENVAQNSAQGNGAPSISTISLQENSILGPASLMMYPTCQGNICKNYAKCSIENSLVKCHCPLGFIGKSCDKVRRVKYPQFSGVDSFLALPRLTNGYKEFEISVKFKPSSDSGLLLFTSEHPTGKGDFFSLALVNGHVEFRFDCGTGPAIIQSPNKVKIGQWNQVKAKRMENQGWLWMNSHGPISGLTQGAYTRITLRTELYLGGHRSMSSIQTRVNTRGGFRGCVQSLIFNQQQYDFRKATQHTDMGIEPGNGRTRSQLGQNVSIDAELGDAVDGQNIEDCSDGVCDHIVCHNGGSCKIISPDQFVCLCPLGFYGPDCVQNGKIEVPEFKGHSVLQYRGLGRNSLSYTEIELTFKPASSDGLILYNGYTNNKLGDYIAILMRQGFAEFQFDLGTGPAVIRSSLPVSLKSWHRIKVSRTGLQGVLEVDDQIPVQGLSKGAYTQLTLLQPLFVGGHPDFDITSRHLNQSSSYQGCVQKLLLNGRPVRLMEEAIHGYNVEPCPHPCNSEPCQNSGKCVPDMGQYKCLCSVGFTEKNCQKNLSISTAKFSGTSFLMYDNEDIKNRVSGKQFNLQIKIRGYSLRGLLFWTSENLPLQEATGDFLSLGFKGNKLLFHYNLGSGRGVISYNKTRLSDGKWHTISAQRNGRHSSLTIDGTHKEEGTSVGTFSILNVKGPVYIGGLPDVSYNTQSLYKTGFQGCVRDVVLANDFPLKLTESATSGQEVTQCPAN